MYSKNKKLKNLAFNKNVTKGNLCLAGSIYTLLSVLHTVNKNFIFLTNDKPVIKIVRHGIIISFSQKNIYSSYWLFKINSGLEK